MNILFPILSTIVSLVFGYAVFAQYLSRRKPYQLVWAIGLLFYASSAFTEVLVGWGVWNVTVFRLWYLIGAFFVAAYLGMGTIYLLVPRRPANVLMLLLVVGSLIATYLVFSAQVNLDAIPVGKLKGDALPNNVRLLTPIFNIFGSAGLVLGALYSAWMYYRRRIFPERVLSNVLIAIGAFFPSLGSTLLRLGVPDLFYVFELFGVLFIFAGFLANHEVIASRLAFRMKPSPSVISSYGNRRQLP